METGNDKTGTDVAGTGSGPFNIQVRAPSEGWEPDQMLPPPGVLLLERLLGLGAELGESL